MSGHKQTSGIVDVPEMRKRGHLTATATCVNQGFAFDRGVKNRLFGQARVVRLFVLVGRCQAGEELWLPFAGNGGVYGVMMEPLSRHKSTGHRRNFGTRV